MLLENSDVKKNAENSISGQTISLQNVRLINERKMRTNSDSVRKSAV